MANKRHHVSVCHHYYFFSTWHVASPQSCVCLCRYNSRTRSQEHLALQQGLELPTLPMSSESRCQQPGPSWTSQQWFQVTIIATVCHQTLQARLNTWIQRRWRPSSDPVWRILVPAPAVEPTHVTASDTTTTAVPPTSQPVSYQVSDTELALHVSVSADISTASLPLMTAWRHKRNLEKGIAAVYKKHKVYSCKKCGQTNTASTGHSKRSGFVYCPNLGKNKKTNGWLKLNRTFPARHG